MKGKIIETYKIKLGDVSLEVDIIETQSGFVREYFLKLPELGVGTEALMNSIKNELIAFTEPLEKPSKEKMQEKKQAIREKAEQLIEKEMKLPEKTKKLLVELITEEMTGLGRIEFMLADGNLEEIVVNQSNEPIWIYHKKHGWLKSNLFITPEEEIENYANIIARKAGKQITILNPLLDAHLPSGDRVNATFTPISTKGNTITIRRFRRSPWTITDLIEQKTISSEIAALIWEAIHYELSIIFSGGTASGKTSILGAFLPFIPANQRIISIEDTREVKAPSFMHWVPLTTREPNPEGKGQVQMIDLLVNSLRMRPDRIIVGEIRRQREAEVLFEAMHTGHAAYTTVHANTAEQTIRRLTNPPVSIPESMLDAVNLNVVMFRNRRLGIRRVLQVAEFITEGIGTEQVTVKANTLYQWKAANDKIVRRSESVRFFSELELFTGLMKNEIEQDLREKQRVLDWMVEQKINTVEEVGKTISKYYSNKKELFEEIKGKSETIKKGISLPKAPKTIMRKKVIGKKMFSKKMKPMKRGKINDSI